MQQFSHTDKQVLEKRIPWKDTSTQWTRRGSFNLRSIRLWAQTKLVWFKGAQNSSWSISPRKQATDESPLMSLSYNFTTKKFLTYWIVTCSSLANRASCFSMYTGAKKVSSWSGISTISTQWRTWWMWSVRMSTKSCTSITTAFKTKRWAATKWTWLHLVPTPSSLSQLSRCLRATPTIQSLASCRSLTLPVLNDRV